MGIRFFFCLLAVQTGGNDKLHPVFLRPDANGSLLTRCKFRLHLVNALLSPHFLTSRWRSGTSTSRDNSCLLGLGLGLGFRVNLRVRRRCNTYIGRTLMGEVERFDILTVEVISANKSGAR